MQINGATSGKDRPDYATSLNNLAGLYHRGQRFDDAEPLAEQALAIFKTVFGGDHPSVATAKKNLVAINAAAQ